MSRKNDWSRASACCCSSARAEDDQSHRVCRWVILRTPITAADEESQSRETQGPEGLGALWECVSLLWAGVGRKGRSFEERQDKDNQLMGGGLFWVRTRQSGSGCMQGDAGKINGYVISLLLSQIGSGGGRRSELKKEA